MDQIRLPKLRIGNRKFDFFPFWIVFLIAGLAVGIYGAIPVLRDGLYVTGLSNQVPWGLWISIDLSSIAMGGGAFVFLAVVYLLRIERFKRVAMLGVVLGFLGYSTAGIVLMMDLGQPLRFWHGLVYWQPRSLLWQITVAVVLYLTVLVAELVPIVLEHEIFHSHPILKKNKFLGKAADFLQKLAGWLHSISPVLAVLGVVLSVFSQAFYGPTYSILAGRGLWFSQAAPIIFILSAIAGGSAMLFITSIIVFRVMRPGLVSDRTLLDIARFAGLVALLTLYIQFWDWAITYFYGFDQQIALQTELLDSVAPYSSTFWISQILFAVIPGIVLVSAKRIKNIKLVAVFAALPIAYAIITRWNYNLSGLIAQITYDPFTPSVILNSYTPSWHEWAVALGVISYWLLGFSLAARYLPFRGDGHHADHPAEGAAAD